MSATRYNRAPGISEFINPQTGRVYSIIRYLGEGSSGDVYEVSSDNKHYAAKAITYMPLYRKEVNVYKIISHDPTCNPYIVCLYDTFIIESGRPLAILIIELMANTLRDVPLTDEEVPSFVLDMLEALVTLHRAGIVHNDLRDDNIFRSLPSHPDEPLFKIGDFSEAQSHSSELCSDEWVRACASAEGTVNATLLQKLTDDYQMAYIFLDKLYKISAEEYDRGLSYILRNELVYPRRESIIPSYALETMIRGMLNPDATGRWSSVDALQYISSFLN